jgi:subtilisin family serine protease
MKTYVINHNREHSYEHIAGLLGEKISHKCLEKVCFVTVQLTEEEYEAMVGAGIDIHESKPAKLLYAPPNIPFRGYPTPYSPINDFLNITNAHLAGFDGTGVKVGILDTGANDSAVDLTPTLIREDFTGTGVQDDYNHGGKACNMIGQVFSAFTGATVTYGMAHGCQLYSLKVYPGGTAELVEAIDWAIDNNLDIINISLQYFDSVEDAIWAAIDAGIIVVCAAGNDEFALMAHPADIDGVIAVNCVDYANASVIAGSYLTWNGEVGVTVTTYNAGSAESFVGGTSQSAFQTSGLLALYKQKYPSLNTSKAINLLRRKAWEMDGYAYDHESTTREKLLNYETGAGFLSPIN